MSSPFSAALQALYEYAELELGGPRGIRDALGISLGALARLTTSANSLSPLAGGRHADVDDRLVIMSLDDSHSSVFEVVDWRVLRST